MSYPRAHFYRKIVAAKLYIDRNFADDIDVENIASEGCFSKFDFIRRFNRTYGQTPRQYLIRVRMEAAAALLKRDALSIQDVCFCVGYQTLSSFSARFREYFGTSPKQFQLQHRQRAALIQKAPLSFVPNCMISMKDGKYIAPTKVFQKK